MNDLKKIAQELQKYGRGGDTILAHINPEEAAMLKAAGGSGTINPTTGLPEFIKLRDIVSVAAPIVGGMFGGPAGAAIGNIVGGIAGSGGGGGQAYGNTAGQQLQAGQMAASAGAFRPVGVTTRFGSSQFQMGTDQFGNPIVTSAGYTVSPELRAIQDRLSALFPQAVTTAEQAAGAGAPLEQAARGLFNLGAGYIAESPEVARQRIFDQLQAARDPARQIEEQRLGAGVFGRGRAGLNIGNIGQPELYALGQAREAQRAQDILAAEQAAQDQIRFGQGLFTGGAGLYDLAFGLPGAGLKPLTSTLAGIQGIEGLGQQPLEIGTALGGRNINQAGAQALLSSGLEVAATGLRGSLQQQQSGQQLLNSFLSDIGGTKGALEIGQQIRSLFNPIFPAPISNSSIYR
jgi:hypothetical protein